MSVSFSWLPVSTNERFFNGGLSNDHTALEGVFGSAPWTFNDNNIAQLTAMGVVSRAGFYDEIINAITDCGESLVQRHY